MYPYLMIPKGGGGVAEEAHVPYTDVYSSHIWQSGNFGVKLWETGCTPFNFYTFYLKQCLAKGNQVYPHNFYTFYLKQCVTP